MRSNIVCSVILVAFGFTALSGQAFGQAPQAKSASVQTQSIKALQAAAVKAHQVSLFTNAKIIRTNKRSFVKYNLETGEIWMVRIMGAPLEGDRGEAVEISFDSRTLKNTSQSDWTGVTVITTFEVLKLQDSKLHLYSLGGDTGMKEVTVERPGIYKVQSSPFTMKPNVDCGGSARVELAAADSKTSIGICYTKVISIQFEFP